MKQIEKDGKTMYVGHALRCPVCGHRILWAPGLGRMELLGGNLICGACGCEIEFGELPEEKEEQTT